MATVEDQELAEAHAAVDDGYLTWDFVRKRLDDIAIERGEWAGYPMPVECAKLVVEKRHPCPNMNGFSVEDKADKAQREIEEAKQQIRAINVFTGRRIDDDLTDTVAEGLVEVAMHLASKIKVRNIFNVFNRDTEVVVYELPNGRVKHTVTVGRRPATRMDMLLDTMGCAVDAHTVGAELQAMASLKTLVTDRAWSCYVLTGCFLESSERSGVTYMFRKLRPTIAIKDGKILRTFCFHPIGYYEKTYTGCLVPTDDVIAHVLVMRTDERRYWAKANSHDLASAQAGI